MTAELLVSVKHKNDFSCTHCTLFQSILLNIVVTLQHVVTTSSGVTTQTTVSHHCPLVMVTTIVETRLMNKIAVSDISLYVTFASCYVLF